MKKRIYNFTKVLIVGCAASLLCAIAITFTASAVALYCNIPSENGYMAVLNFLVATISAALAMFTLYFSGAWIVRKGAFSR